MSICAHFTYPPLFMSFTRDEMRFFIRFTPVGFIQPWNFQMFQFGLQLLSDNREYATKPDTAHCRGSLFTILAQIFQKELWQATHNSRYLNYAVAFSLRKPSSVKRIVATLVKANFWKRKHIQKNRFLETFWHIIMFSKVISLLKLRTSVTKILPHLQDTWFIEVSFQSRLKKTNAYFILKKPRYEQTSHIDVSLARLYHTSTAFHKVPWRN